MSFTIGLLLGVVVGLALGRALMLLPEWDDTR